METRLLPLHALSGLVCLGGAKRRAGEPTPAPPAGPGNRVVKGWEWEGRLSEQEPPHPWLPS